MYLVDLLLHYQYAILLPLATLEGPIVAIAAGFLVSIGKMDPLIVFVILMLGDFFGDVAYYALGRWTRKEFIRRWGQYIGVTPERVEKLEGYFRRHDWKILLFAKTQAFGSAILFTAGAMRMSLRTYIVYNILGSFPKVILFEAAGIYLGRGFLSVAESYLNTAGIVSLVVAAMILGMYWIAKRFFRDEKLDQ